MAPFSWEKEPPQNPGRITLHIWQAQDTDQLATPEECAILRELTFRIVALARAQTAHHGHLYLSLAGGRKTMSADLQAAGEFFGSHALLHVIDTGKLPDPLRSPQPVIFTAPLPRDLAQHIRPLNLGGQPASELIAIPPAIDAAHFPLPPSNSGDALRWRSQPSEMSCHQTVTARQRESQQLLGNFVSELRRNETYDNWPSLYRLPPASLQILRGTPLISHHRHWVNSLPKADLHRHIGGCLSLAQQKDVAQVIWANASDEEKASAEQIIAPLLAHAKHHHDWPWHWPLHLRAKDNHLNPHRHRATCSAALLIHTPETFLERQLFGHTEPRIALKTQHPQGFSAYERPGELTGSAVLGHPAALAAYAQALVHNARQENLLYLELRGSPHKYRPQDPIGFLHDLRSALQNAGATPCDQENPIAALERATQPLLIGFIWILDRRAEPQDTANIIQKASQARERLGAFLLGLDLAGDEGQRSPDQLAHHFTPAFRACLPITIHAGEGESAENIWQAAYQLHADRIGHGLTLADNPPLAQRFRDRRILLELCPSSNREVIGYRDPAHPASAHQPDYPLPQLMQQGIPLTLCTDNPGISRTTLTDEYLTAARMIQGAQPLSQWQTLALLRQAFAHAFLPARTREALSQYADHKTYTIIQRSLESTEH